MNVVNNMAFKGRNLNEAWESIFDEINRQAKEGTLNSSRDGDVVGEIINAMIIVEDPTRNILTSPIRKMPMRYAIGEFLWYLSGNPTLQAIGHYTSAWERMSDDGETVNSNYGYIIQSKHDFNQFDYCYELLKKDPNSRQAIIHIKTPQNTIAHPTKDLNCTVYCQFFIREEDGKPALFMSTHMRSNDLWMGVPYDCFFFMNLQVLMAMRLGIEVGTYTHYAGSLHMYARDYESALINLEEISRKNP